MYTYNMQKRPSVSYSDWLLVIYINFTYPNVMFDMSPQAIWMEYAIILIVSPMKPSADSEL